VAHGSTVNCMQIGRKSGSVMVTGGDDKKVNVWAIGRANAIMSLSGHTSAVECVSFDSNEQTVIAGSAGGTLKLWDLEQAKVARTLTGHRSNCISVQWHPYGEFFASGSVDTNLKIWDLRRRTCIQTYKGHARGVRQIIFSPDGRWVVSGGDDGVVKLWDLTMGKLVHEFTQHSAAISALAIHPTEFLMASASVDRTLRLWDLESFEQVCCTPPESGQVRRAVFSDDGSALLSGADESLKVWGWEPVRCFEQAEVRWSRLSDLCVAPGQQLVGGSIRESMVAVWKLDLSLMKPFSTLESTTEPAACGSPPSTTPATVATTGANGRMAGDGGRHNSPCSESPLSATSRDGDGDDAAALCARLQIAQCRAQLAARRASQGSGSAAGNMAPAAEGGSTPSVQSSSSAAKGLTELSSSGRHASVGTSMTDTLDTVQNAPSGSMHSQRSSCPRGASSAHRGAAASTVPSDHLLADLVKSSARQEACLAERLTALRTLRSFWEAGEVKRMLQYLQRLDTPSALDIVRSGVLTQGGRLDLECALALMPTLAALLQSTYDEHVVAAVEAVSHLLLTFGHLISSTRAIGRDMLGVDLSAEARQQRCQACYEHFAALVPRVRELSTGSGGKLAQKPALELLQALHGELGLQ